MGLLGIEFKRTESERILPHNLIDINISIDSAPKQNENKHQKTMRNLIELITNISITTNKNYPFGY